MTQSGKPEPHTASPHEPSGLAAQGVDAIEQLSLSLLSSSW
ncbi:hypothetical protein [Paenibacillus tengchongensis]|nr:hypothetical protein [Paenibacillus tengchongensis]